jgi:hypothetical protein
LAGLSLVLLVLLVFFRNGKPVEVRLSDGRILRIEAVTFGTNHVVGWSDAWLVPLRKVFPARWVQFIGPRRGQSRHRTESPTLVVWVHAFDGAKSNYN